MQVIIPRTSYVNMMGFKKGLDRLKKSGPQWIYLRNMHTFFILNHKNNMLLGKKLEKLYKQH